LPIRKASLSNIYLVFCHSPSITQWIPGFITYVVLEDERELVEALDAVLVVEIVDEDDAGPKEKRPPEVTPQPSSGLLSF
jgi:hypothetical protein